MIVDSGARNQVAPLPPTVSANAAWPEDQRPLDTMSRYDVERRIRSGPLSSTLRLRWLIRKVNDIRVNGHRWFAGNPMGLVVRERRYRDG